MPQFEAIQNLRNKLYNKIDLPLTGVIINISDVISTDALADSVDWFWYDMEHGPFSPQTLRNHIMVAHGRGKPAIVRIPGPNLSLSSKPLSSLYGQQIKHALDSNADGIIIPQVRTATEIKEVIFDCLYPPQGRRGFGPSIPTNYGRLQLGEYIKNANKNIFIGINIETKESVNNIDEICQIKELDFIAFGINDLCGSYNIPYDVGYNHIIIQNAVNKVINACKQYNKYIIYSPINHKTVGLARKMVKQGCEMVLCGNDIAGLVNYHTNLRNKIRSKL